MRNYKEELDKRCEYIKALVSDTRSQGVVFGNSGGKDSALVGILCKKALPDKRVLGILMPCESRRNFETDFSDAVELAEKFGIETMSVDLTAPKLEICRAVGEHMTLSELGKNNVAPRLRMTAVYLAAASLGLLVAGTGNKSERYTGYFTKWGDGAHDFNPISDLTVTEVYEFLDYLGCTKAIMEKAPSGGLFDGQTDEGEMGVTYKEIDAYLAGGTVSPDAKATIDRLHSRSEHKRIPISTYEAWQKSKR